MRTIAAVLLSIIAAACSDDEPSAEECTPSPAGAPNVWRDATGRTVMYRGVNLGTGKYAPGNLPPVDASDYERMAEWGMTSVRLVVFWEAIEPERGVYDETYLAGILAHAELAAASGLDVLIDMHQDVYGEGFGFVGFPRWTCTQELYDAFEPPSTWFLGYLTTPVSECFDRFWRSPELRAAYAEAAALVARRLAVVPSVVAFEIINEPYWGTISTLEFEPELLQPFYDEVAAAVREAAPRLAIVAEPSVAHNFGIPPELSAPFGCPTWMYAPHYYPLISNEPYVDERDEIASGVALMWDEAVALGAPLAVTEIGMEAHIPGAADYLRDFFAALDPYPASAWLWDYGPDIGFALVDLEHQPRASVPGIIRPYATRLNGELLEQRWDPASGVYALRWRSSGAAHATEIVATSGIFPQGYTVGGAEGLRVEQGTRRLRVFAPAGEVSLTLTRL